MSCGFPRGSARVWAKLESRGQAVIGVCTPGPSIHYLGLPTDKRAPTGQIRLFFALALRRNCGLKAIAQEPKKSINIKNLGRNPPSSGDP